MFKNKANISVIDLKRVKTLQAYQERLLELYEETENCINIDYYRELVK